MSPSTTFTVGLLIRPTLMPLLLQRDHRIQRPVDGLAGRHDVSAAAFGRLANDIVLARLEWACPGRAACPSSSRMSGTGARVLNTKRSPGSLIDALHAGGELMLIDGEVQPRRILANGSGVTPPSAYMLLIPKWQVLSPMSSTPLWLKCASTLEKFRRAIVISLMHISRNALKVREDALLARRGAKAGGRREVAALHDAAADKNLGMLLADVMQAARPLEVVVEHPHAREALLPGSCRRAIR